MEPRPKEFRFPLAAHWLGGRAVGVNVAGKPLLRVTVPPEFRGTEPSVWSPEDLFVGAAASCFAVTLTGLAERAGLDLHGLGVEAEGVAGRREDGRFGFTRIVLDARVDVAPGDEGRVRELAEKAEETCLVSVSLALPVELRLEVRAAAAA